jgi:hypothetical protein
MKWESQPAWKIFLYWCVLWAIIWGVAALLVDSAHADTPQACPAGFVVDRVEGCQEAGVWVRNTTASKPKKTVVPWQWRTDVWMPSHWYRLASCESGSTPPNWSHHTFYEGAFGFAPSTWRGYKYAGYPEHAYQANPYQQYKVALRVARATGGIRFPWGCWRGSQHAWVRGNVSYYAVE